MRQFEFYDDVVILEIALAVGIQLTSNKQVSEDTHAHAMLV